MITTTHIGYGIRNRKNKTKKKLNRSYTDLLKEKAKKLRSKRQIGKRNDQITIDKKNQQKIVVQSQETIKPENPNFMHGTEVYRTRYVYEDIINHIENEEGFSIARFGDGDLKNIAAIREAQRKGIDFSKKNVPDNKVNSVLGIDGIKFIMQGIPYRGVNEMLEIYRDSANSANYISSFDAWFSRDYWMSKVSKYPRVKNLLKNYKLYYDDLGIENTSYCNPDISFFLFLDGSTNLLGYVKDKKICLITSWSNAAKNLSLFGYDVDFIEITPLTPSQEVRRYLAPRNGIWHFDTYKDTLEEIDKRIGEFDVFFLASGFIGRIYSKYIKEHGKVAIDIGQVMNAWNHGEIAGRMGRFIKFGETPLTFKLKNDAKPYRNVI